MPSVMRRASKILNEYGATQSELIGKAVVLADGKAGTVENVWLDELHSPDVSPARTLRRSTWRRLAAWLSTLRRWIVSAPAQMTASAPYPSSKPKGSADLLKDLPCGTEVETVAKITIKDI